MDQWKWDDIQGIDPLTRKIAREATIGVKGVKAEAGGHPFARPQPARDDPAPVVVVERTRIARPAITPVSGRAGPKPNPVTAGERDQMIKSMDRTGHHKHFIAQTVGCSYPTLMKRLKLLKAMAQ